MHRFELNEKCYHNEWLFESKNPLFLALSALTFWTFNSFMIAKDKHHFLKKLQPLSKNSVPARRFHIKAKRCVILQALAR